MGRFAGLCVASAHLRIRFAERTDFAGGTSVKRPAGITILAILIFCGAALCAIVGIVSFAGGAFIANHLQNPALERFALSGGAFLGVYALCFAGVYGITGFGLWTLRGWGRIMGIILDILWLVVFGLGLAQLFPAANPWVLAEYIIYLLISAAVLWYFFRPNVKQAFAKAQ